MLEGDDNGSMGEQKRLSLGATGFFLMASPPEALPREKTALKQRRQKSDN